MQLTTGFVELLDEFVMVFNAPTFLLFVDIMTGWTLSHRRRFVTDLILSAGAVGKGHFSNYHRFFSQYVWELDGLSKALTLLLVRVFVPTGLIELAVDDTLCRRRGLTIYGTGMHYDPFGFHATVEVKTLKALYYKSGRDRLLVIVLVRDVLGKRPDQMFYCTRLNWGARKILAAYAGRWSIEVTFENCKQLLGFNDPANRKEKAVRRTAPMSLVLYSLIVAWFDREGHRYVQFPNRPWYPRKEEPSFADMLTTLRRRSWENKLRGLLPKRGRLKKHVTEIIHFLSLAG